MINILIKISALLFPLLIAAIFIFALIKKINTYEAFIDGAKEGIKNSIQIIPYLLAIIVAVGMLRASGFFEFLSQEFGFIFKITNTPSEILPLVFIRSLSGSAVLGLFSDIVEKFGPDDFASLLSAIMVGSSETTFYVLSVYFGYVGIKKFRYAIIVGILSDCAGVFFAFLIASMFFAR